MKKERGAITVITLVTILFMLSFLISTFVIISNRRQAQAEIKKETKGIYEAEIGNEEEIYQSYFADENDPIPIYTAKQLIKVGTGENVFINNKIYKLTSSANYILMNDVSFKVADYITENPDLFPEKTYIGTELTTEAVTNKVTDFEYTGAVQTYEITGEGTFKLEVWGAQGGNPRSSTSGGLGGYSVGTVTLNKDDVNKLYVYVGQQGADNTSSTAVYDGYNGGRCTYILWRRRRRSYGY